MKRDVRYRQLIGRKKPLRPIQTLRGQILVNRMPRGILERAGEVVLAQACDLRQLIQVKLTIEFRFNKFTDTPQAPWIKYPAARRRRRSVAIVPGIFVN